MKANFSANGVISFLILFSSLFLQSCSTTTENESSEPRQQIDLIIEGDYVVSMDAAGSVYEDAAIAVDEGLIIAIGAASKINSVYKSAHTLQGNNRVVMPGLINGHSHAAMTLLRGVAEDMALVEWLNNYIFPQKSSSLMPTLSVSALNWPVGK